jgi:hypothetical protein
VNDSFADLPDRLQLNDSFADLPDRLQVSLAIGRILVPPDQTVRRPIRRLRRCRQPRGQNSFEVLTGGEAVEMDGEADLVELGLSGRATFTAARPIISGV